MSSEITCDPARVHVAVRIVSDRLERERRDRIAARNTQHVEQGGVICGHWIGRVREQCTRPAVRAYQIGARCEQHTPAALAGRPEPQTRCVRPLRCYCERCLPDLPLPVLNNQTPAASSSAWTDRAKLAVLNLAHSGIPFTSEDVTQRVGAPDTQLRSDAHRLMDALMRGAEARHLITRTGRSRRSATGGELIEWSGANAREAERDNRYT